MSSKLTKLQKQWNQKLKDSGFEDIEQADGNLKSWDSMRFMRRPQQVRSSQEYYYRATQMLETYAFEFKYERKIWEMHSEAIGVREIAAKVKRPIPEVCTIINKIKRVLLGTN